MDPSEDVVEPLPPRGYTDAQLRERKKFWMNVRRNNQPRVRKRAKPGTPTPTSTQLTTGPRLPIPLEPLPGPKTIPTTDSHFTRTTGAPAHPQQKGGSSKLHMALLNTHSAVKHAAIINDFIGERDVDCMTLTETWLRDSSGPSIDMLVPDEYSIHLCNRSEGLGGGVAVLSKNCLKLHAKPWSIGQDCEALWLTYNPHSCFTLNILAIYRPPRSSTDLAVVLLETILPLSSPNVGTLLLGDLNKWKGNPTDKGATLLEKCLNNLGFTTLPLVPTHKLGNTLDWVCAKHIEISDLTVTPCAWSDHHTIDFWVNLPTKPSPEHYPPTTVITRNFRKVSRATILATLERMMGAIKLGDRPESMVEAYYSHMHEMVDTHAPLARKKVRATQSRKSSDWSTDHVKQLRASKRSAERKWRKDGLVLDHDTWKKAATDYTAGITVAKRDHYDVKITNSKCRPREIFRILRHLENPVPVTTAFTPADEDCARTQAFFRDKILRARDKISSDLRTLDGGANPPRAEPASWVGERFHFSPITLADLLVALKGLRPSSGCNDPIPARLVLDNLDIFGEFLVALTNSSFSWGSVPTYIKEVKVKPLLKKTGADPRDPANLRPITLVNLLLKILDKVGITQYQHHIIEKNVLHPRQAGFRAGSGTETALLDLQSRMFLLMDRGSSGLLVLLDLSAAFDLLDHDLLLEVLSNRAGCSDQAIRWFKSFLSGRRSKVCWGDGSAQLEDIRFGVPQGSCLSPSLFNTYLGPLFDILDSRGICFTNYADDTQLLLELSGDYLQDCAMLAETYGIIEAWMTRSWMCLNASKTELILIGSRDSPIRANEAYKSFELGSCSIPVLTKSKTLGVFVDSLVSMVEHADQTISKSQYPIRLIRTTRPFLSTESSTTIARALVLTKLDYCNSLLGGCNAELIQRLQVVQNDAVRAITGTPRHLPISDHRRALHWLPVADRIKYKLLCLAFKCASGTGPAYLNDYCQHYTSPRSARLADRGLLQRPVIRRVRAGGRAFPTRAAIAWNELSQDLRKAPSLAIFKKMLKTHLFN